MSDVEIEMWMYVARKVAKFVLLFGGAILLPILAFQPVRRKARERERLQMKIVDELAKYQ
jgi:uncharacterized membrane protein